MADFKTIVVLLSVFLIGGQYTASGSDVCTEPPELVCPVCDCDGIRHPHPHECEWYYECKDGTPVLTKCENGLHFNPSVGICDYPCYAGCGEVTTPKPTDPPTNPPTDPPPTNPPTDPPTNPPTDPPTNPPTDPPTNPPTDPPTNPPTDPPTNPPTEPPPSGCPSTNGAPEPQCPFPDPALSVFFPHPNDCHWFYHCSNGVAYCKECPDGLHWNVAKDTCDWPHDAGCENNTRRNVRGRIVHW